MKEAIRVAEKNMDKLLQQLINVQRLARTRTTEIGIIAPIIEDVEYALDQLLYRKDWDGITAHIDTNSTSFPKNYKGIPESTILRLERKSGNWYACFYRGRTQSKSISIYGFQDKAQQMAEFVTAKYR